MRVSSASPGLTARAVGPEQAEQLSGPDLQIQAVNRSNVAEPLGEPAGRDRGRDVRRVAGYLRPACFTQGWLFFVPWHFRICSGEQSSGLPFSSFGHGHFSFLPYMVRLLSSG